MIIKKYNFRSFNWISILILFSWSKAFPQDAEIFRPDSVKKEIIAEPIYSSLRIDGVLNEPEWKTAKNSLPFTQIEPYQGMAPRYETDVRVLYNRQFLYFAIFCRDSLGKKALRAIDFKRDFDVRQHDLIALSFDGFNDKRNAMAFVANPYGVQRDLLAFDDLYYDSDWDGLWRVRTTRTDSGWVAEIRIPWQTLRYPKRSDSIQHWGFNIYRNRRLTNEISAFSPFPRSFSALRMNYAGVLKNLRPPPPKPNIRIQPYTLLAVDQYHGGDPSVSSNDTNFKFGGELKWAINTSTVLDLTTNTDFAQADADRQVNNVTRFSVFFPERRQFFLENASLFGAGVSQSSDGSGGPMRIQPFFSRSIGLDDKGNPIPIDAGGRFVYRSSKRNFGALLMRQRSVDGTPSTNFSVLRYSENFGKQNRVGGLITIRNRPDDSNFVSALDGFFRIAESHSLNMMMIQSTSTYSRKQGFSGFAQYFYSTNQTKVWCTQTIVTKDFDPAMGFVSRKDVIGTTSGIIWYYRGRKLPYRSWLRAWEPGLNPEFYHQASTGKLIEATVPVYPVWLNLQSGASFGYGIVPTFQHLTDPFEPLGTKIQAGEYRFMRHQIYLNTDPSRKLNLQILFTGGTYFNGMLNSMDCQLQFAPIPHLSIKGRFNRNNFVSVGELKGINNVDLYSVEGRFALNPRIQLIGFYQQNTTNDFQNFNIRLSWEYQPLSFIYIVFNHGTSDVSQQNLSESHVIAKISYLRQI